MIFYSQARIKRVTKFLLIELIIIFKKREEFN